MADYPAGVYAPRTKANRTGVVYDAVKTTVGYAEDITKLDAEVVAIETELGATPKAGYADVAARLAGIEGSIPSVPVKATGAEIDTGTNDTKFATPLAIADSKLSFSDGVETLTNKRITTRIITIVSNAQPTINTDDCDCITITALATAITSMTTNLSGAPTNFQKLIFRIKDDGSVRAITWGASFIAKGVALPTTTTASKLLTVGFIFDTVANTWGCVASVVET
jgi:hypothetical protein